MIAGGANTSCLLSILPNLVPLVGETLKKSARTLKVSHVPTLKSRRVPEYPLLAVFEQRIFTPNRGTDKFARTCAKIVCLAVTEPAVSPLKSMKHIQ